MKALWHLLYWPAVALSLLCIPLNCAVMLVSYIFDSRFCFALLVIAMVGFACLVTL